MAEKKKEVPRDSSFRADLAKAKADAARARKVTKLAHEKAMNA